MKHYKVSQYLHYYPVAEEMYVGWNRYFPAVFILNDTAREFLESIKNNEPLPTGEDVDAFIEELKKFKFIYQGDTDPSPVDYFQMTVQHLEKSKQSLDALQQPDISYESVSIMVDECNLGCSYCVNQYKYDPDPVKMKWTDKLDAAKKCVDQYITKRKKAAAQKTDASEDDKEMKIFFNGGEILTAWPLVKDLTEYLVEKYKDETFSFSMNTNMTLMTDEIAGFLVKHRFQVSISIDGYRGPHDRSRVYHSGEGSYDDVLKGLEIYNKHSKDKPLKGFQGAVNEVEGFAPEAVYQMESLGFTRARLAPNLLDTDEADAVKKAGLMGRFLQMNQDNTFKVTEFFFSNARRVINKEIFEFKAYCKGLSCYPTVSFSLNLSSMQVSQVCGFVPPASMPLADLDYDIYNPRLSEHSYRFIEGRAEALKKLCAGCEAIGVCGGGCVFNGLDNENVLNKAACAYQKEMWRIYLQKAYRDRQKKKNKGS